MLSLALMSVLTASPEFIEPWGLSLGTRDDAVVIASVRPDSPAARAKLKVGDVLLRIRSPKPDVAVLGTLDEASLIPVTRFLSDLKGGQLVIDLAGETRSRTLRYEVKQFKPSPTTPGRVDGPWATPWNDDMRTPRIDFGPQRGKVTAWVDPQSKKLLAVNAGGATGEHLWGMFGASYRCSGVKAHTITVKGEALRTPVYVDLKPDKLHGGAHEVQVPLATLEAVTKCPATPLVTTLELTLTCEDGSTIEGREKPVLEVKCEKPEGYQPPVFSAWQPFSEERVTEGVATFAVNPFASSGPQPTRVDVLVLNGKDVVTQLPNAWTAKEAAEFKRANVPAPKKAGTYSVVYEATWSDGTKSRSEPGVLTVQTKADAARSTEAVTNGMLTMRVVQERMKDEGVDVCDSKTAMPWLRKQPEVDQVRPGLKGDGYSFTVKGWHMPHVVHCHAK